MGVRRLRIGRVVEEGDQPAFLEVSESCEGADARVGDTGASGSGEY